MSPWGEETHKGGREYNRRSLSLTPASHAHPQQTLPSPFVGPRRSRPEQGELRGGLAGSAEDDPVPRLLPRLGLHLLASRHTNHCRVCVPFKLPPPPQTLSLLSASLCLRLTAPLPSLHLVSWRSGRAAIWLLHVSVFPPISVFSSALIVAEK